VSVEKSELSAPTTILPTTPQLEGSTEDLGHRSIYISVLCTFAFCLNSF